ncbi:MAG: hypothetical protein KDI75_04795, partial [Xanthomonadales bacterium]|nr:hypothetical protein [Xanthomonadales bacterium]
MFIAAWASTFKAWWPFLAFGWLLLAKLSAAIQPGQAPVERMRRMQSCWVLGAMAYLAGVFLTLFIPVPRFGITASVVSQLDLPGGGIQGNAEQVSATGMMSQSFASRAAGRRQCSLPWQELGREWRAIEASPHHWKSIGWG